MASFTRFPGLRINLLEKIKYCEIETDMKALEGLYEYSISRNRKTLSGFPDIRMPYFSNIHTHLYALDKKVMTKTIFKCSVLPQLLFAPNIYFSRKQGNKLMANKMNVTTTVFNLQ